MHASWGNTIEAEDAFERMGADVMRWQYCAQPPDRNLLFGFGPAEEVKRELLTFWNSVKFFVDYANIVGFEPSWSALNLEPDARDPLDRWLVERTHAFVARRDGRVRALPRRVGVMREFEEYRRRPLELVHPPLAAPLLGRRRPRAVPDALVRARPDAARDGADPAVRHRPPLADARPRRAGVGAPRRLAGGRRAGSGAARRDRRRAARRRARPAGALVARASSCGSRCAGSSSRARASTGTCDEIADELRVKYGRARHGRGGRAAREAEPAGARAEARQGARRRPRGARGRRVRGAAATAGSASPDTSWSRTRCSSSAAGARAGRSRPATA